MSHASSQVRFPDGSVFWSEYNGTADVLTPLLYATFDEMWANWRNYHLWADAKCTCDRAPVTAVYWTSYGDGWTFNVLACRACLVVISGDPFDEIAEGSPDWLLPYPGAADGSP